MCDIEHDDGSNLSLKTVDYDSEENEIIHEKGKTDLNYTKTLEQILFKIEY